MKRAFKLWYSFERCYLFAAIFLGLHLAEGATPEGLTYLTFAVAYTGAAIFALNHETRKHD